MGFVENRLDRSDVENFAGASWVWKKPKNFFVKYNKMCGDRKQFCPISGAFGFLRAAVKGSFIYEL